MKINFTSNNRTRVITSFPINSATSINRAQSVTISRVGARDGKLLRKIIGLTDKGKGFELRLPYVDNWCLSEQIKDGDHSVFVAHIHPAKGKSKLVGIATVNRWPHENQIDTFEVRSGFRRFGLGQRFLTSVMKCFRTDQPLTVWSLPTSIPFFNSAFTGVTGIEKMSVDDGTEFKFPPGTIQRAVDRMAARIPHQKFRTNSV